MNAEKFKISLNKEPQVWKTVDMLRLLKREYQVLSNMCTINLGFYTLFSYLLTHLSTLYSSTTDWQCQADDMNFSLPLKDSGDGGFMLCCI